MFHTCWVQLTFLIDGQIVCSRLTRFSREFFGEIWIAQVTHIITKLVTVDSPFAAYLFMCIPRVLVLHHCLLSYNFVPTFPHADIMATTVVKDQTHYWGLELWCVLATASPALRARWMHLPVLPVTHIGLLRYGSVHLSVYNTPVATQITAK